MEEFLPILIGIIWIAYKFYTKGLKKRTPKEVEPTSQKSSPVESLINEIFGERAKPQTDDFSFESFDPENLDLVEEEEKVLVKKTPEPFLQHEISKYKSEGEHAFQSNPQDTFEIENIDYNEETEKFNLRKAVIYSEILNAPYL